MILPDIIQPQQLTADGDHQGIVSLFESAKLKETSTAAPRELTASFSFAVGHLPERSIEMIVTQLDCHSLKNLLLADETLRRHAYLFHISHSRVPKPFFFNISGITQTTVSYLNRSAIAKHGRLINLFEVKTQRWYRTSEGYLNCHLLANDSELSFVAINRNLKLSDMGTKLKEPIFTQLKKSKIVFAGSKFDTDSDLSAPPSAGEHSVEVMKSLIKSKTSNPLGHLNQPKLRTRGALKHLTTLEITGASVVENLRLPFLRNFTIIFHNLQESASPSSGAVPSSSSSSSNSPPYTNGTTPGAPSFGIIKDIRACAVEHFSVNYYGEMPLFQFVDVGTQPRSTNVDENEKSSCFELCDTSAYGLNDGDCIVNSTTKLSNYKDMDLRFTKFFQYFVIVGAHDVVFKFMDLSRALDVLWMKTVSYPESNDIELTELKYTPGNLYAPKLKELSFQTSVPDTTVPHFNLPSLEYLVIYTNAEGTVLNGLLSKIGNDIERIRIICELPLDKVGGSSHIVLSKADVDMLLGGGSSSNSLRHVKIEGCYFGDSNCLFPLQSSYTSSSKSKDSFIDFSIKCVRRNLSGKNSRSIELFTTPHLDGPSTKFETLAVTQVKGGPSYSGFNKLKVHSLPFPAYENGVDVRFVVSRDFEDISVNGKSLHTVLMTNGVHDGRPAEWILRYGLERPLYAGSDSRDYYVDIF